MRIQQLFERDINRSINGVVKADQLDAPAVWQELDEFVVTHELNRHLNDLAALLLSTMENDDDAADKIGIWIAGFFGCGKSHFLKVLSYLLENREHEHAGEKRRPIEFFQAKLNDPLLTADWQRIVAASTDTILFNIDSKADQQLGRDALLRVFLKVLNERQGFSGDFPHIAHMERHLAEKGKLEQFHATFEREAGASWLAERDAWEFNRDHVVKALSETLGQSEESVLNWVETGGDNFSLTVENFAKWVKRYLDSKGPNHRVMFLVDEVGQFIGGDTHLMLNLQTVTEQLGLECRGRAWVVVTSQEDLDKVLGELNNVRQHDFSKIQGRFKTRLSLSSQNADEVIKKRILHKNDAAKAALVEAYKGKHDLLKNDLSFVNTGMTFKTYADDQEFAICYPFAAYQFALVQKVFESIRKAGATGLHLSEGERSTLDAFQSAAKAVGDREIGALVPFYLFYPAVEGFLDTAVKRTIDQASDNHSLEPFDTTVLRVLFLIRYIDELPGNVDNLVTLCVDEMDMDRLALRKKIEASLARLEGETLIARNGDLYFFLTNEERDIGREIKNINIAPGTEERELGAMIFGDILGDVRKHMYSKTGRDFEFTRICDDHPVGNRIEGSLEVSFVSPLGDRYADLLDDPRCIMETSGEQGRVLVCLPDRNDHLGRELRAYLQTEAYVKAKNTSMLPDATKRILRDRSEDNRARRARLVNNLRDAIAGARYFASGKKLAIGKTNAKEALGEALEYVIENSYPKMAYIKHFHQSPKQEIQTTLRANDVEQVSLTLGTPEANTEALADLRDHIELCKRTNKQIVLHELIEKRYGARPYGWPELEVVLLVAKLAVLKEIDLVVEKESLPLDEAYDHLVSTNKQRRVIIVQRETAGSTLLKNAQALGKELFAEQGPDGEEKLFSFLKSRLEDWHRDLETYRALAATGKYPGLAEIEDGLTSLRKFVEEIDSLRFLNRFIENRDDLLDRNDDYTDLREFYQHQKHSWEQLNAALDELQLNRMQLDANDEARAAIQRMEGIQGTVRPYQLVREVGTLIATATAVNRQLIDATRGPAVGEIQGHLTRVVEELDRVAADEQIRRSATGKLEQLLRTASDNASIAHISQARQMAGSAYDEAVATIENAMTAAPAGDALPEAPKVKRRRVVAASDYWTAGCLEKPEDVDAFLTALRAALMAMLDDDERIQIN